MNMSLCNIGKRIYIFSSFVNFFNLEPPGIISTRSAAPTDRDRVAPTNNQPRLPPSAASAPPLSSTSRLLSPAPVTGLARAMGPDRPGWPGLPRLQRPVDNPRRCWRQRSPAQRGWRRFLLVLRRCVATRPEWIKSLCSGVIPGSVMLTPHSTSKDL